MTASSDLPHSWDLSPKEAVALQKRLREQIVTHDDFGEIRRVAGADVGFEEKGAVTRAVVSVFSWPGLEPLEDAIARQPTRMPYIPGLLSFREIPAYIEALRSLADPPDLLFGDGHGVAHPRRFGVSSHLGLYAGIPTFGVGKSRLVGEHEEPGPNKGDWTPLTDHGERIGAVLRTRTRVKPIFISTGHRVSLESAIRFALAATTRYRLPETTRRADKLASRRGKAGKSTG
jgi:deoxyribonuclease V